MLVDTFDTLDTYATYWSLLHGLRAGDSRSVEWLTPNDSTWFENGYKLSIDWWYYYYWSYIDIQDSVPYVEWTIKFSRNSEVVNTRNIYFPKPEVIVDDTADSTLMVFDAKSDPQKPKIWQSEMLVPNDMSVDCSFEVYSMQGRLKLKGKTSSNSPISLIGLSPGVYIVSLITDQFGRLSERIVVQ